VPVSPSVTVTLLIDTEPATAAASSFVIVPTPWPSLIVAPPVAPDRLTKNVSLGSTVVSPLIVTETVCVLTPLPKESMPAVAT
jgi:hypothetical protein